MADSRPTERAMKAAVEMEMHAVVGTTTVAKGETLDKCFPAYDDLLEALTAIAGYAKMRSSQWRQRFPEFSQAMNKSIGESERIGLICNLADDAIAKAEGRS